MLAKKLLTKKNIGKIYFVKIEYVNGTAKTNKNKVGSMSDIGSHSLNLFEYFLLEINLLLQITLLKKMSIFLKMIMVL